MKYYVTGMILFILLILDIFCNDILLAKFHQNSFKIKDFRIELMRYNKNYFNFAHLRTFKYNRTTPATNCTFKMKVTVKDKLEILAQAHKFLSNEYRHFPVRFQVNMKKTIDSNVIGLASIKNCGNLTSFILEKDITYHFCNYVVDETHFPPLIPNVIPKKKFQKKKYRIDLTELYLNEEIAFLHLYCEVYTPIEYPKK